MTEMRDARLKRALQAAPDVQQLPQEATRHAVREAARRAVRPRGSGWWARWLSSPQRMPWNAAFATVLLASLVGLLWQGREPPDARTDSSRADAVSPPQPAPAPAPAGSSPAPASAAPQTQAAPPQRMSEAKPAPSTAAQTLARQERETRPARERLGKSAPQDLARQREAAAPLQDSTAARGAAPVASPPPAPEPAPAAELSARPQAAPGWQQWSQLRIERDGKALTVSRERASHLAGLIEQAAASATTQQPLAEAPQWKLELHRDGRPLGVLEIAGTQLRWTAPGVGARTGRPEPAQLLALREELQRLLPR